MLAKFVLMTFLLTLNMFLTIGGHSRLFRSNLQEVFRKKDVERFENFTRKQLCQSHFLKKLKAVSEAMEQLNSKLNKLNGILKHGNMEFHKKEFIRE